MSYVDSDGWLLDKLISLGKGFGAGLRVKLLWLPLRDLAVAEDNLLK